MKNKKDFNYRLTEFFLNNTRLTILSFILLLLLGAISLFALQTTGFPTPSVNTAIVSTLYPGASSEVVAQDVTKVLEGAIKSVDGIESYTSVSRNSLSTIVITIDASNNVDTVQNKIATALRSVTLPTGSEDPQISVPLVGGADFTFSLASQNKEKLYHVWASFKKDLGEIAETARIEPLVDLKQRVVVKLNTDAVLRTGLTIEEIQRQIASLGENLPVVNNITIEGLNQTITTKISGNSLTDLQELKIFFKSGQQVVSIPLKDLASIELDYYFENNAVSFSGVRVGTEYKVLPAVVFNIRTSAQADKVAYAEQIFEKLHSYERLAMLTEENWHNYQTADVLFIENISTNNSTKEQVNEVISGLIGGPLPFSGPLSGLGWFLGGMQLVFLAMLCFVSWRAAFVAAVAIPLSLLFATIYLYFRGDSLNTLVLFSLVLVLGLVVDPALVILESIQRQIDLGIEKKQAGLLAVKDVGRGLFLAALTNIIVFAPFGVISGILGQIFAYIPLTIIPATIGSYIVPLIFLVWFGSSFLKKTKGKIADEEQNLWAVARWLIRTNEKILHSRAWVRLLIVFVALAIPLVVTANLVGSGKIKFVQFASSENAQYIALSGTFLPGVTEAEKQILQRQTLTHIVDTKYVKQVFPQTTRFSYVIEVVPSHDRPGITSVEIARELEEKLDSELNPYLFDWQIAVRGNGPPPSSYKVSLAIKTDDLFLLERASKQVGETVLAACKKSLGVVTIDFQCSPENKVVVKVDDGYTGKENHALDVVLDREDIFTHQLVLPSGPLSLWVNQQMKRLFNLADDKKVGTIKVNNEDVNVFLDKESIDPYTKLSLEEAEIRTTLGEVETLNGIAEVIPSNPKDTIQGVKGQTVGVVQARLRPQDNDEQIAALVTQAVVKYYHDNGGENARSLGLTADAIEQYSEGSSASFAKSFNELILALFLAIILTYFVLAIFFNSLGQPLVILFTIPLTFLGVFPALATFTPGEFGFLEIIGLIILVGVVENVAIFLIDAARQRINENGWEEKRAISFAAGLRLRPVILTKITAIASLAPLAFLSEFYRSISLVIIFGLITSGFTSLVTTPILFIFFRWLSRAFQALPWWHKILFFPLMPLYIIGMGFMKTGEAH